MDLDKIRNKAARMRPKKSGGARRCTIARLALVGEERNFRNTNHNNGKQQLRVARGSSIIKDPHHLTSKRHCRMPSGLEVDMFYVHVM